jgi:prevent-host-death family protein
MRTFNMHEAKTHLSRLVKAAANGEPFIIARAGKPVVKVVAVEAPGAGATRRVGFMAGKISVPEDFDRMGSEEIKSMFEGDS